MPCRALLDQIAEAYSHADRNALMALYREDALVCSAAEPDTAVGRDELFGRADVLQRTQLIGAIDLISIDEAAGLIRANARVAVGQGQYRTTERVWLLTFKEASSIANAFSDRATKRLHCTPRTAWISGCSRRPPSPPRQYDRYGRSSAFIRRRRNRQQLPPLDHSADRGRKSCGARDSRANLRRAGPTQGDDGAQPRGAGRAVAEHSQAASERPDRVASSARERPARTQLAPARYARRRADPVWLSAHGR